MRVPATAVISTSAPAPPPSVTLPPAFPVIAPPIDTDPFAKTVTLPASPERPPPFTLSGAPVVTLPPASRSIVPPPSSPPEALIPLPAIVIEPWGAITATSPPSSGADAFRDPWITRSPPLQVPWAATLPQSGMSSAQVLPSLGPPTHTPSRSMAPPKPAACVALASSSPSTCMAPRVASSIRPPCGPPLRSIFPFVVLLASTRMSPAVTTERVGNEPLGAEPRIDAPASTRRLPARISSVPDVNARLAPGLRSSARPPKSRVVLGATVTSAVTTQGSALAAQRSVACEAAAAARRGVSPSRRSTAAIHRTARRSARRTWETSKGPTP